MNDRAYRQGRLVMDSKQDLVDEIERLRAALKPFADFAEMVEREHPGWYHERFAWAVSNAVREPAQLYMGQFMRAREALSVEQSDQSRGRMSDGAPEAPRPPQHPEHGAHPETDKP